MIPNVVRQLSIIACLVGIATALVFFLARWNGTPTPRWMPVLVALIGVYELAQWGQSLWLHRVGRRP